MLRRSLKGVVEPGILDLIVADCGIDLEKRPQDLEPKEFAKLANFVTSLNRQ
jgi:16S rRNA A1518/A1519 N6-dimethyltransferase RsmA/KsgA/DIM1 with predicted DNA glycosylase/AP lyase activity